MSDDKKLRLKRVDLSRKIKDDAEYEARLESAQDCLHKLQSAYFHQQRRGIVVFEGWDAAGKGGIIRRLTEKLDPRSFQVHQIGAPRPDEQGRHYLYRFWRRLPKPGSIAVFDRSWYGRVLVERVEGLIDKKTLKRSYQEINDFEKMLVADGARIVKLFVHIDKAEQLQRFKARLLDPYKRWKLTDEDIRNRERWDDYVDATEDMFDETSTEHARWHVLAGNDKAVARVDALELIFEELAKGVDLTPPDIDHELLQQALDRLGLKESEKAAVEKAVAEEPPKTIKKASRKHKK